MDLLLILLIMAVVFVILVLRQTPTNTAILSSVVIGLCLLIAGLLLFGLEFAGKTLKF